MDDVLDQWLKTEEAENNWASVRVAAGTYVGYVAVYNWLGSASNRARLGDFEIWVGRAAGDRDTANGAVKCGESSYDESSLAEEPYVMWCGNQASRGWSDGGGGEYITLTQVGASRELRITELKVYEAPVEQSPEASPVPQPKLQPMLPPPSASPSPPSSAYPRREYPGCSESDFQGDLDGSGVASASSHELVEQCRAM